MNYDDLKTNLSYKFQVGVISGDSKERSSNKEGLTNAELLFIQENGSPLRNLPARPVLQITIDYVNETLLEKIVDSAIGRYLKDGKNGLEQELNKYCMRIQSYARKIIYDNDGRLAPNAESTIKAKGFNHPLFVTGQLARSIVCVVVNDKGVKV